MRSFSKRHRQIVYTAFNGLCAICGTFLTKGWHADHVIPYSKGGRTDLYNCQPLCPHCNLKKSNNMNEEQVFKPYKWQQLFTDAFIRAFKSRHDIGARQTFLAHVGVGGGKTLGAIYAIRDLISKRRIDDDPDLKDYSIVVISPSREVQRNWSEEAVNFFGIDIDHGYSFKYQFAHDFEGISITYHSLNINNISFMIKNKIVNKKTILVIDEVHHCGEDKTWGSAVEELSYYAAFTVGLSGTPFREDDSKIPMFQYDIINDKHVLLVDYKYTYKDLIIDKKCAPISFRVEDIIWLGKTYTREEPTDNHGILHKAVTPGENGNKFIDNIIFRADQKLQNLRLKEPTFGGLIVCSTIQDAKDIQLRFPELNAVLVTSDDNEGHNIMSKFREDNSRWIIAVDMIAEGVNIPRLRVIVYLSIKRTRLYITQVSGRIVRKYGKIGAYDLKLFGVDHAYFYLPAFEKSVQIVTEIEDTYRHIVKEMDDNSKISCFTHTDKDYTPRVPIDGDIDSQEGSAINSGVTITYDEMRSIEFDANNEDLPETTVERLFTRWRQQENMKTSKGRKEAKRDMITNIRREINSFAGKIAWHTDLEFYEVHGTLNRKSGIHNSESASYEELINKKKIAKEWYEKVA